MLNLDNGRKCFRVGIVLARIRIMNSSANFLIARINKYNTNCTYMHICKVRKDNEYIIDDT